MSTPVQESDKRQSDRDQDGNGNSRQDAELDREGTAQPKDFALKEAMIGMIDQILDKPGRFQVALLLLISINSTIVAFNHTLPTFHSYTPRFFCADHGDIVSEGCVGANETCEGGYEFEEDDNTLVSEWDLVCSRVLLKPLVSTFYFSGVTVGAIVCGILADKYGRYLTMVICLNAQCVFGLALFAAQNLTTFIVLRTIQGFFVQGLQTASFALLLEFCPPRHRTATGVLWEIFWAIGCALLGGLAFIVADWRWLQIVLAVPSVVSLTYIWLIPESPSWLTTVGKFSQAQKVCEKICKRNGKQIQIEENENNVFKMNELKKCIKNNNSADSKDEIIKSENNFSKIVKSNTLRKFGLVMMFTWFSVVITYYGIIFHLPSLYGQRHINFVIGAAIEVVAYLIAYCLMMKFGRKKPIIAYQITTGIICGIVAVIVYTGQDSDPAVGTLMTVLVLLSQGCCVSSSCCMFIYVVELFPTTVRGAAVGICGFWGRIGSLLSAQLIVLGEYSHPALPLAILGMSNLFGGFFCNALPETMGLKLTNTVEESEQLFAVKKKT